MINNQDIIDVEVIKMGDSNDVDVFDNASFIESQNDVSSHEHLMHLVNRLNPDDYDDYADGKTYSTDLGTLIWRTQLFTVKKYEPKSEYENKILVSALKLLYAYTITGEYPLMQQLCNYFGVSVDQYYAIMKTSSDPRMGVYNWIYNIFDATAMSNAIKSNGNFNARQWIDRSREGRISADQAVQLAQNERKISSFDRIGATIANQLMVGDDID